MKYDSTRYLRSKTTVDDRALNRVVFDSLKQSLSSGPVDVLELGAGVGTMVSRALSWGLVERGTWTLLDEDAASLDDAKRWLAEWCARQKLPCTSGDDVLVIDAKLEVRLVCRRLDAWLDETHDQWSLLVANAFLDLVDLRESLPKLAQLVAPGGRYWFTINFDGESIFLPPEADDDAVLAVYHRSMDTRTRGGRPAGNSRTGRSLFAHLEPSGFGVSAAGSSDWVVHAHGGRYPDDEAYFLEHIVHTVEAELLSRPTEIDGPVVSRWAQRRRQQIANGRLTYIAHQLDFTGARR